MEAEASALKNMADDAVVGKMCVLAMAKDVLSKTHRNRDDVVDVRKHACQSCE